MTLVMLFTVLSFVLYFIPTGYEKRNVNKSVRCKGEVIEIDNSELMQLGMLKKGSQTVTLRLLDGPYQGEILQGLNQLLGRLDRDKIFVKGDIAFVVLSLDEENRILFVNPQEHYRLGYELLLLGVFITLLIIFGGWTGAKAILSFVFAVMTLWKVLVPILLAGLNPILYSVGIVFLLSAAIIFLVAGLTRMGLVAFLGACLGTTTSCVLAQIFTNLIHIHGAILPFSETLLYSGFGHLDLASIYVSAVFIAASGAVMDIAIDVSASMKEVVDKKPDIGFSEAAKSGLFVGRAVVGTMTTTLLFAYSGGYVTMLMAFMAQGIPITNILNLVYVSAEVVKVLVGSFGLVMVAPFTAILGAYVFTRNKGKTVLTEEDQIVIKEGGSSPVEALF